MGKFLRNIVRLVPSSSFRFGEWILILHKKHHSLYEFRSYYWKSPQTPSNHHHPQHKHIKNLQCLRKRLLYHYKEKTTLWYTLYLWCCLGEFHIRNPSFKSTSQLRWSWFSTLVNLDRKRRFWKRKDSESRW